MAKENSKKKARFTCPNRIFTFSFRCSFVTLVTRAQNIRKFNLCGSQCAGSFSLLSLFLSLHFAGLFVLDLFVVDFDFYGCQRALKVAKRVTLHSIPLRLWRVFSSPVNRLQSRVANWNSAWGGDEGACFEAPFWWLLNVEKGQNKCCQCCWAGIKNK